MVSRSNLEQRGKPGLYPMKGPTAGPTSGPRMSRLQPETVDPATGGPPGPANLRPGGSMSTTQKLGMRGRRGLYDLGQEDVGQLSKPGAPQQGGLLSTLRNAAASRGPLASRLFPGAETPPPVDTSQVGIQESLGSAYVDPMDAAAHARRGFATPEPDLGGNSTTGLPREEGAAGRRQRRDRR